MNEVAFWEEKAKGLERVLEDIRKRAVNVKAEFDLSRESLYHRHSAIDFEAYCNARLASSLANEIMNHVTVEVEDRGILGRRYSVVVPILKPAEKRDE